MSGKPHIREDVDHFLRTTDTPELLPAELRAMAARWESIGQHLAAMIAQERAEQAERTRR